MGRLLPSTLEYRHCPVRCGLLLSANKIRDAHIQSSHELECFDLRPAPTITTSGRCEIAAYFSNFLVARLSRPLGIADFISDKRDLCLTSVAGARSIIYFYESQIDNIQMSIDRADTNRFQDKQC